MAAPRSSTEDGGHRFVTAVASSSSHASNEASQYVTASMDEVQILAAIEKSREQGWSEVADHVREGAVGASLRGLGVEDKALWEKLKKEAPYTFLDSIPGLELGRLIAEGGQAHIYEASRSDGSEFRFVAKVFKMEAFSLMELHRQWPRVNVSSSGSEGSSGSESLSATFQGSLLIESWRSSTANFMDWSSLHFVYWGSFLENGRFVFVSPAYSGDLRSLINFRLKKNNGQGPPFSVRDASYITYSIAEGMNGLHKEGVLHRDLKAANVLWKPSRKPFGSLCTWNCVVADYESSMLVQGTGFWRAPEVLEDLLKEPCERNEDIWTEKVDVYSFAMTCYEVMTGHVPFDGYVKSDWPRVIAGERPHMPDYVDPFLGELVERCWHKEPSKRPSFDVIVEHLKQICVMTFSEKA